MMVDRKKKRRIRAGFSLLETLVAGGFLAVATLGLTASMVSGLTLEIRAKRTMSRVATAENMIEEIRADSITNFNDLVLKYGDSTRSELNAAGEEASNHLVNMRIPLVESEVPGTIDLDGNGLTDTVTNDQARLLVLDVGGDDSLRLRTIVHNRSKLSGLWFDQDASTTSVAPVTYGEVRSPGETTETTATETTSVSEPLAAAPESANGVTVDAISWNDKGIDIVLKAETGDQKVVAVGVVPYEDDIYTNNVALGGTVIYKFTGHEKPGSIKIDAPTPLAINGQTNVKFANFQMWDIALGQWVSARPRSATFTFYFADGTALSTQIRN